MNVLNGNTNGTTNLVVIEPKDTKLDDITIDLPAAKTISILAATYENYNVKVITQTNNGEENLITNIVAVKKGDDLVVTGADASKVIFRGFYTLCEDGACTVTLGGEEEGVTITPDSPVGEALSDGSFMIYTYADSGVLADMLTEDDGETLGLSELPEGKVSYVPIEKTNAQENNDEGSHWGWIAGGIALAAVGIKAFDDSDNNVNTPTTGEVTITGTQTQGEILTADTSALMDDDGKGTFSYQWWASDADGTNNEAIADATSKALTLTQAQVGKTITVVVTHTDAQGTVESAITSAATAAVTNVNDPTLGDVTITKAQTGAATPAQGETLTADTSAVTDVDGVGTFTYQWQADDVDIVGATKNTLILTQAQVGKAITVVVIHTDAQGTVEPAITSMATDPVENVNDPTTGSVTIDGTAAEDQNLTADTSALKDDDGAVHTFTYQWQADGADIVNATSARLTLKQAHVGKHITVEVSYTDGQGTTETITSAPTNMVTNVNDDPTGRVTIDGTAAEDQSLIANTSKLADEDGLGTFTYQWWASDADGSNNEAISGETDNTLILTQAHVGQTITVVVSYTDGQNTPETLTSIATAEVTNINDDPVGLPTISGDFIEGETLTANTDAIRDADGLGADGFTYQWQAGDTDISGATGSTFVLTQAQVDQTITLKVMYTDGQGTAEILTSIATAEVTNTNDGPTGAVTIDGILRQGERLTANTSTLADVDGLDTDLLSYQWQAGNNDISGATGSTFVLTQAQVGQTITVEVNYTDGQGTAETIISAQTAMVVNVNDPSIGDVGIDGILRQGEQLTANTSTLADVDGLDTDLLSYQWQAGSNDISGADEATFVLTQAQVGQTITLKVMYTDGQGTAETRTSAPIATRVANINDEPIGLPTISGALSQGETLTAQIGDIRDADGLGADGFTYQWQAGGNDISGAMGESFELTQAQVGQTITLKVMYTDGQGTPETLTSIATAEVTNTNDAPTGAVTIDGILRQGEQLTANTSTLADVDGLDTDLLSYQWQAGSNDISGADEATFVLTQAQVGQTITLKVMYTDGQGTAETIISAAVATTVGNINDAPIGLPTITGTPTQGATLTVNTDGIADADGLGADGFTYQWQAGGNDISGAMGESFELTQAQVGQTITLKVMYTDGQGTAETLTSAATNAVTNTNDAPIGLPTITGTPTQGATLTVNTDGIADADGLGVFSYQWQANGTDISGADEATFELTQAQVGATITVKVSYTDGGNTAETLTSAATATVTNTNDAPTGLPTISGTATQGATLTVNTDGIADTDGLGVFSYQWQAGGTAINGATGTTFELTQAQVGATITVKVSYTDDGSTAESLTSAATNAVTNTNDAPTGLPTISGTPTQGATLTVNTDGIADADGLGAFSYQWQAGGTAISGATGTTFALTQAQVGVTITVKVSYTDGGSTAESLTSIATAEVGNENDAPTGLLTIDGTLTQGETLTADTSRITDPDGPESLSFTYQWQAGGNDITDATESTFVLTQAQVGQTITVKVSYTDNGGTDETLTSAESGKVANTITINKITDNNIINAIEAAENANTLITGTVAVDGTVTLTIGGEDRTVDAINGIWSYTLTATEIAAMGEGTETITARATDAAGNPGTASHEFTVDTQVSTLTINKFNMDDLITSQTGGGAIFGTVEAGSSVSLRFVSDDDTVSATLNINAADTSYSFWQALVPDSILTYQGNVTVTATATDAVHNTKEASYTFTVDTEVPLLTIDPVTGDGYINKSEVDTGNIQISGTFSSTLTLNIAGQDRSTAVIRTGSIWRYILTSDDLSNMGEGPETIKVEATDEVGNKKTLNHPIVVDTMDPTISIDNIDTGDNDVIDSNDLTTAISGTPFIGTTISGTVEAGSTVKLFFGEVDRSLEVRVRGDGTWFYPLTKLEISGLIGQGEKFITATAVDPAGNTKEATASFTIDTQVSDLTINPVTDGNIINAIEAAANANTEITGTVEAGSTVTLTIGNEERDAPVTSTTWSYTLTADEIAAMGQGDETITVTATDSVGNTKQITHEFTVDTIAPVFSSDTAVTVDVDENVDIATVVYTAQATDAGGITYSLGGMDANAFTIDAASGEVTLIAAANFAAKSIYTLDVIATDAAGNAATQAVTVTVNDVTPPVFPRGDAVSVDENTPITTVVYDAQATDAGAARDVGITYSLKDVNDADAFNINIATGEVRLNHPANFETKQSYIIDVIATDATGNEATQTVTVTVNDLTPPVFSSDATVTVDENADITTPVYTAQATDAGGITYTLSGDDANDFTIDATSGEVTLKVAADFENKPSYTLVVTATDATGNFATQTVTVNVNNVNEAPTGLPIISGALSQGATLTADISNIADPDGLETDGFSYQWQAGGTAIDGATGSTFVLTQAQVGETITVTVSYTDNGGKDETLISAESEEEVVNTITINKITDDNIINVMEAAENSNTQIIGTVAAGGPVTLNIGGNVRTAIVLESDGTWSYTLIPDDITNLVEGENTITATANDAEDNAHTESHTFTVDRVPPTISIGEDIASDDIINGSEVTTTITGTVAAGSTVKLGFSNEERDADVDVDGTTWSYTLTSDDISAMGEGEEIITVTATDTAENTALATRTIIVDTVPPTISINEDIASDDIINSNEVTTTITGTVEADSTVKLTIGGNVRTADVSGTNWSYTLTSDDISAMGEGDETIEATATDTAGNERTMTRAITVDTVLPTITINDIPDGNTINADEVASGTQITGTVEADSTVKLTIGGNVHIATLSTSDTTWSYTLTDADITAMGQGAKTITATATDSAENTKDASLEITVDTVAPTIVFNPVTNDNIINANEATENANTEIRGTVDTADTEVTLTIGNMDRETELTGNSWSYILTPADINAMEQGDNTITARATDPAGNEGTRSQDFTVDTIVPVFSSDATASVNENADINTPVYNAEATDAGGDNDAGITYSLSGTDADAFNIDAASGVVTLKVSADFESKPSYTLDVIATDAANNAVTQAVTVNVIDVDDTAPVFSSGATGSVDENAAINTPVYNAEATDAGGDNDAGITYSLSGTDADAFNIDAASGVVTLKAPADFEEKESYTLVVTATDAAGNAATQTVTVTVNDVDDTAPVFSSGATATASVDENAAINTPVYNAEATDAGGDNDAGITYSLSGTDADAFNIDAASGVVTLKAPADYETQNSYALNVIATDAVGNAVTQAVTVNVIDVDDTAPVFSSGATATASVDENAAINTPVYNAEATDAGGDNDAGITYSLSGTDADAFNIDAASGVVTLKVSADFESKPSYTLDVIATDAANNAVTQAVTVNVIDVDDTAPVFSSGATGSVDENAAINTPVYNAEATDAGGDNDAGITYSLSGTDADAFNIDAASGVVTLKAPADFEEKESYTLVVTATDAAGNAATQTVTVTVNDVDDTAPEFSSGATATVDENAAINTLVYNAQATDAGGDNDVGITYSLSGTDAALFDINDASGVVTLKAPADFEEKNSYALVVTATDAAGNAATQAVTVTVNDVDDTAPVFSSGATATASVDENAAINTPVYNAQATDNNGEADVGITYSLSGTDADAFNIDAASGVVTLKAPADFESKPSYDLVVTATDAADNAATQAVTVTVTNVNDPTTGVVTINGTATQGETLTANTSALADEDGLGAFTYVWQADDVVISGATNNTLTLTQAHVGKAITVVVSHADGQSNAETVTSTPTVAVTNVNDEPTGLPTISGDLSQGATLTAITEDISDPDGPESLSFTYQWLASGTDISGATEETFVLTEEQVGETITVRVFYTDNGNTAETLISAESEEEVVNTITINSVTVDNTINASEAASSNTQITGTVAAGGPVTLTIGGVDRIADVSTSDNTWSYTLIDADITAMVEGENTITARAADASGIDRIESHTFDVDRVLPTTISINEDIAGDDIINAREAESGTEITGIVEAGSTVKLLFGSNIRDADVDGTTWSYSLTSDDIAAMGQGRETFTITATDSAGNPRSISHNIIVDTIAPSIGGTPDITVDQDVAYSFTPTRADSDTGTDLTYSITGNPSWLSIDASTGELSGTPTNDDVDTTIGIVITVMDAAGGATSLPAFNLEVINVNDAPTITGEPPTTVAEDIGYSFVPGGGDIDIDVGGNALVYSITTDDTELPSWLNFDTATGALTGTPENDDVGTITGIVISVNDGIAALVSLPAFSITVTNVNDPTTGVVTINGIAAEDQMLTANTSALADEDGLGTFNYVWQADGAAIAGETDNTLTLTQAHVGKIITVVVTHTDLRGFTELEITSTATAAVTNVNDAGAVAISGRVRDGQTLTATVTDDDGIEGVDISYQWQADNVAIAGATGNSLVLTTAQVGQNIKVTVSYTDQLGENENFTSEATIAVTPDNDPTLGDVTITGAATQGETLTANTEALEDEDGVGTFTYQWWVSDADGSNNEAIAGATSETFRLRQEQVGKTITVVVVHTDARGTVEPELTSAATAAVVVHSDAPTQTAAITAVTDNEGSSQSTLADDEVTDDTTPTLSGTVSSALTSGQVLAIYDGSTKLGDATVTDTSWTFTPSELTAGSHSFTVRVENTALDLRGAVSDPREVKINTSISMAVEDDKGLVQGELNPAMRYILVKQTGESLHQLWLSEVEVFSGGVNVALGKTVTAGAISGPQFQPSAVTNGVTATEGLSNGYASQPLTTDNWVLIDLGANYYIDKVKLYALRDSSAAIRNIRNVDIFASKENFSAQSYPELTANLNAINLGGTAASPAYKTVLNYSVTTDDNTPTLLGTLATALGANEELAIYKGTTKLGVATVSADNTWTYTPTDTNPLADGKHKLKAVIQATGVTDIAEAHVIGAARTIEVDSTIMAPTQTATIERVLVNVQNNEAFSSALPVGVTTHDTTLLFEGSLSAALTGDQVLVIYDGNGMTKLGEATVAGTIWSYTPIHALATGSHSFIARVESPIGGISTSTSSAREVTINSIINVEVTDNVGAEKGLVDNFTDDNTPTLSGALAIALGTNEELAIYNGNTKLGVATVAASDNTWTFTPTAMLADGVYELKAIIQAAGVTGIANARVISAVSTITIVTTAPAQTATIDRANDDVSTHGSATVALMSGVTTDDTTPTLAGTLNAALTNYQVLAIYDGDSSTKLGDAVVTDTSWSYTPSALPAGSHGFTARVENTVGALKGAVSSTFVVNINPSISMIVTDDVDPVLGVVDSFTDDNRPTLSGTLAATLGAGEELAIYDGSTKLGVASISPTDNSWDFTPALAAALADGAHALKAVIQATGVTDIAEARVISATSTITILTTDPTQIATIMAVSDDVSTNGSSTGNVLNGATTDDDTPTLTGLLNTELFPGQTLEIYDDHGGSTIKLGEAVVASDLSWSYTPEPLAAGSHRFTAQVENPIGDAQGVPSGAHVVNINPSISMTLSDDGGVLNAEARYILLKRTDKSSGGLGIAEVEVFVGEVNVARESSSVKVKTKEGSDGDPLKIIDGSNSFNNSYLDNPPTDNDIWLLIDLGKNHAIDNVKIHALGFSTSFAKDVDVFISKMDLSTESYADLLANANALRLGGTGSTPGSETRLTVPAVTTDDSTPTLSGTLATALGADEELAIYDGSTKLDTVTVNADKTWTYTPAETNPLAEGSHTLKAVIQEVNKTDIAEARVISAASTFTVDTTSAAASGSAETEGATAPQAAAPQEAMYSSFASSLEATLTMQVNDDVGALTGKIAEGADTDDSTVSLTGTVTNFDTDGSVQVYDGETLLGNATIGSTVDGVTSWSYTPTALAIGSHTIAAFFVDGVGTPSTNSASTSFTVTATDTTFSAIATTDPISGLSVQTYSLASTAMDQTLDFSGVHPKISVVNIAGSGANTVKIQLDDVLQTDINLFNNDNGWVGLDGVGKHQLVVNGDADDTLVLDTDAEKENWILAAETTSNSDQTYLVYNHTDGISQVLVDQDLIGTGAII